MGGGGTGVLCGGHREGEGAGAAGPAASGRDTARGDTGGAGEGGGVEGSGPAASARRTTMSRCVDRSSATSRCQPTAHRRPDGLAHGGGAHGRADCAAGPDRLRCGAGGQGRFRQKGPQPGSSASLCFPANEQTSIPPQSQSVNRNLPQPMHVTFVPSLLEGLIILHTTAPYQATRPIPTTPTRGAKKSEAQQMQMHGT